MIQEHLLAIDIEVVHASDRLGEIFDDRTDRDAARDLPAGRATHPVGDNEQVNIEATASATAVFACINGGQKNPSAANKQTVNAEV